MLRWRMVSAPRRPIATILLLTAVVCGSLFTVHCTIACSLEAARLGGASGAASPPPMQARTQDRAGHAGCDAAPLMAALKCPAASVALVPNAATAVVTAESATMTVRPATRRMGSVWHDPSPPPSVAALPLRI